MSETAGHRDEQLLIAYLEDALSPEDRHVFETRLAQEPALAEAYEALCETSRSLEALGRDWRGRAPRVDIANAVMRRAAALDPAGRDALAGRVLDYLEGALNSADRAAFEAELDANPALAAELSAYRALHADLEALGEAVAGRISTPDLTHAVLERVRSQAPEDEEFAALLDAIAADEAAPGDAEAWAAAPEAAHEIARATQLRDDLHALGDAVRASAPSIALEAEVMARVEAVREVAKVAPLRRPRPAPEEAFARRTGPGPWFARVTAAAAGVALVAGLGYLALAPDRAGPDEMLAQAPHAADHTSMDPAPVDLAIAETSSVMPELPPWPDFLAPDPHSEEHVRARRAGAVSAEDVLEARRESAVRGAAAGGRLQLLAALSDSQLDALFESDALGFEAMLGALRYLPRDEAIALLLDQLARRPDDPYLRSALALAYGGDPEGREHLAAWAELDSGNALPHYLEARALLAAGDAEGALALLQAAALRDRAHHYTLASAQQHEQALLAAGVDPDAARLLAALNGGMREYGEVSLLARDLLAHGERYEAAGDYRTAEEIYAAVLEMGGQLDDSAAFAYERLAALEAQQQALGSLQALYELLGNTDNLHTLVEGFHLLTRGIQELTHLLGAQNEFFNGGDLQTILTIAGAILSLGDLGLF